MRGGREEASAPHDMVRCMLCNDIVNEPLESRARVLVFNLCTVGCMSTCLVVTRWQGLHLTSSDAKLGVMYWPEEEDEDIRTYPEYPAACKCSLKAK